MLLTSLDACVEKKMMDEGHGFSFDVFNGRKEESGWQAAMSCESSIWLTLMVTYHSPRALYQSAGLYQYL